MLRSLARGCYRYRWAILGSWVALLASVLVLSNLFGGVFRDEFTLPGSESQEAFDLLEQQGMPSLSGFSGQIVFTADDVRDPTVRQGMEDLFTEIEKAVPESEVVSPYGEGANFQVSEDGTIAYASLNLSDRPDPEYDDAAAATRQIVDRQAESGDRLAGVRIELGGEIFFQEPEFSSEVVGLGAAVVILLVAFGSLLAMGLPLLIAGFGVGTGAALVGLLANIITMPTFSTQAVMMIGIGVGIDYSLFIVTRYREELAGDADTEPAVRTAMGTAGRAVLVAGGTVIIAVLGLVLVNIDIVRGLAVGISLGVLMTLVATQTLLPSVLGFVGRNIDRFGLPHRTTVQTADRDDSIWHRWSRLVQRRPWPTLVIAVVVLLVLAVPLLGLRLGFGDAGNRPTSDTTRRAYDLISEGFGPGANGPLIVAIRTPRGVAESEGLGQLSMALNETPGVQSATPPQPSPQGTAAAIIVIPETSPQAEATTDLVHTLRNDVIPSALEGSSAEALVGGMTAAVVDFAEYMDVRTFWLIGVVLLLSFLVLVVMFHSLVVPLKAVLMNLLSVGASYGVLVAVFQWGWGNDLLGVGREGPIDAWIPMMVFAIVFGLSMDYEVFLLSRIRERYDETGDNATSVADGLASTARVITAAAAIMVCVFGAFVLGDARPLQMFGLGLAVAIAVDATLVRLVLVPSAMELLGDRNWWLPGWLERTLPGTSGASPPSEPSGDGASAREATRPGSGRDQYATSRRAGGGD